MADPTQFLWSAVLLGAGATLVMDVAAIARRRWFGTPAADWGLVGRWLGHMTRGRFRHEAIAAAPPLRGERTIGWIAHYVTGIAYAALLLALRGLDWLAHPTLLPALAVGLGTAVAPFLLMQPGMGAGLFARRTPNPNAARVRTLVTHGIFGAGLYAAGWILALLRA